MGRLQANSCVTLHGKLPYEVPESVDPDRMMKVSIFSLFSLRHGYVRRRFQQYASSSSHEKDDYQGGSEDQGNPRENGKKDN